MATTRSDAAVREPSAAWSGWAGFAALMLMIIGGLDFFEGLIAIIRKQYYVATPNQIIVFNVTTWGWIMLFWGILLAFAGWGLLQRSSWARWFTIVLVSLNLIAQLGFVGSSAYPLWALVVVALQITVLFALTARWNEGESVN